jgi:predicted PurR-regulated permease PerM
MATTDEHAGTAPGDPDRVARASAAGRPWTVESRTVARVCVIALSLVAAFLLAVWLYGVLAHFLFLVLLAWLFAVAMEPGIRFFMRHGRSRGLGTALTGLIGLVCVVGLVVLFGDLLVQQLAELVKALPSAARSAIDWVNATFHANLDVSTVQSSLNLSSDQLSSVAGSLGGGVLGVVDSLASVVLDLATVLVFGFYIAAAGPRFLQAIATGLRPGAQRVFVTVAEITAQKTGGYVASKIILAALSALCHTVVFALLQVPYWLPFGLFVGITAQFVPLIGTYIGVALPVLATLDSPVKAVVIVAFAAVYQQVENYVFTPKVSQRTMDVNPAIALAAVFAGAAIWGPVGALIGIPLAAAGFAIADTFSKRYELIPEVADPSQAIDAAPAAPA